MDFFSSLAYPEVGVWYGRLRGLLGPNEHNALYLVAPPEYDNIYARVASGIKVILDAIDDDPAAGIDQLTSVIVRNNERDEIITAVLGEDVYIRARCRTTLCVNRLRSALFVSIGAFWKGGGLRGCERFNTGLTPRACKWLVEGFAQSLGASRQTEFVGSESEGKLTSVGPYLLSATLELIATGEIKNPW